MVSETGRNFEYIENANTKALVRHLEPIKKDRDQKIKDIKEEINNMCLEPEEKKRQIDVSYVFPNSIILFRTIIVCSDCLRCYM